MSFLTNYSTINVTNTLTTNNFVPNSVSFNISNATLTGGTAGQVLVAGANSDVNFKTLSNTSVLLAPGSNTQVLYSDTSIPSGFGTSPNLTYDKTTSTLNVIGNTITSNITATCTVTIDDVTNMHVTGGLPGQAITTNGNGVLSWNFIGVSGITADILNPNPYIYFEIYPSTNPNPLPAGTTTALWTTTTEFTGSIQVGTQFAYSNDPQFVLTVTAVQSEPNYITGGVNYAVTWYPPIRYAMNTYQPPAQTPNSILLATTQQFGNLIVPTGSLSASVANNQLTFTGKTVAGNTNEIQIVKSGNFSSSANLVSQFGAIGLTGNLNVSGTTNGTGGVIAGNSVQFIGNGTITNYNGNTNFQANVNINGTLTQGSITRGIRYADYFGTVQTPVYPNVNAAVVWSSATVNNTALVAGSDNFTFTNTTNLTMYVYASYQIAWPNNGSGATRTCFFAINNNLTQLKFGQISFENNPQNFTVQNNSSLLVLKPGDYFRVYVNHTDSGALTIGGAYAGMTAGQSNRLTFTLL